ncbi:YfaP family protein [Anatilimnocola sp. NA78]|uniref:YfaP family protein n=1 Tax=Anatilimnocola sp. NA78 TaxID=3415683 RepID=UPI003CE5556F
MSMVVHLMALIALALWSVDASPVRGQVELVGTPAEAEPEAFVQMLTPAEPVDDLDELLSQAAGDMTDLPDGSDLALQDFNTDITAPGSFDFSRDVIPNGELMQELGGGAGSGEGGGGSGGLGPGLEIGNMMQFVERLQRAGAKTGDVQISLIWDNFNDLDLHVITPRNENIFFGHRRSRCRGELDVDMNAGVGTSREPVENIYWGKGKAPFGKFRVAVHHFRNHGAPDPTPFELRVLVDGKTEVIKGEISLGSPRLIMYEFERKPGDGLLRSGPASVSAPSPNDDFPLLSGRRYSPSNLLEND